MLQTGPSAPISEEGIVYSSSAAIEHQPVASGLAVKFEARKETPSSVVETGTSEKGKCMKTSTQPNDKKSDKVLSTLQSECWSSFSRTSNNSLYSELYRFKSLKSLDLASPQDPSESMMLSAVSGMENAHMGPTKSEDISLSEHDTGRSQEKAIDLQRQSSSPTYEDAWKSKLNSQLEQERRHYQEHLNDLQTALGVTPLEEGVNFENSDPQKIPILSHEHSNDLGKAQSKPHSR